MTQSGEDPRQVFRGAAGQVASGVAIVITMVDGEPHAATASSGVVASLDPPLLAVFFSLGSRMHDCLTQSGSFTVSLLARPIMGWRGASRTRLAQVVGPGSPVLRSCGAIEPPILARAAAWFDCRVRQIVTMGDHACFVARWSDADAIRRHHRSSTTAAGFTLWAPRRRPRPGRPSTAVI